MTINTEELVNGAGTAVEALLEVVPGIPGPVLATLEKALPLLVSWIDAELAGGRDPLPKILMLTLTTADAAADEAEAVKFSKESAP
jgi:cell division protein FtsX